MVLTLSGNMSVTIVSAFYQVNTLLFAHHILCLQRLLSLQVPIVLYTCHSLEEYTRDYQLRTNPTLVRVRKLESLVEEEAIAGALHSMRQKSLLPTVFFDSPPFVSSDYYRLGWGKLKLLQEVAQDNPFHTTHVFWLDALALTDELLFDRTLSWPDPYKLQILGDRFLLPTLHHQVPRSQESLNILRSNRPRISSYFLGGVRETIRKVCNSFHDTTKQLLSEGWAQDEAHVLEIMLVNAPDLYFPWYPTRERFGNLPMPQRDLMIPYELAQGTFINIPYPRQEELIVVLISPLTRPIARALSESCAHYGYGLVRYPSEEVARDYLNRSYTQYVLLLRHEEVFMVGCAQELIHKLQQYGDDLVTPIYREIADIRVVLGRRESVVAYLTQTHSQSLVLDYESVYVATYHSNTLTYHPQRRWCNRISRQEPVLLHFPHSIPRGLWEGQMMLLHQQPAPVTGPGPQYTYPLFITMLLVVVLILLFIYL